MEKTAAILRPSISRKARDVEALKELIDKYNVIAVSSLYKVRSIQLQELAKRFRSEFQMKVVKNTLLKRALKASSKPKIASLGETLTGSSILILTNMNPFRLYRLLEMNKIKMAAKAGDIAPSDIIIPAGNTGLPPGPVISELSEAGIRTRIESGSVYVLRDTVVAKKGEHIEPKIASVLSKLGVKPIEVGLTLSAAYDGGVILREEDLRIDIEKFRSDLKEALSNAFNLSFKAAYPTPENISLLLQEAHRSVWSLAISINYATPETVTHLLAKAYESMVNLSKLMAKVDRKAAPPEFSG
jgi:large subunit ribosomal protein L10